MTHLDHYKTFVVPQEDKVKALIEKLHADILLPIDMRLIDELAYEIEVLKKLDWDNYKLLEAQRKCEENT